MVDQLEAARQLAQENQADAQERQKQEYDKKAHVCDFQLENLRAWQAEDVTQLEVWHMEDLAQQDTQWVDDLACKETQDWADQEFRARLPALEKVHIEVLEWQVVLMARAVEMTEDH
ncbi:hypothetical protein Y1Q_0000514 [Alligator mississippiensis]|uniref:Uncharacterized protein n=1 Tax=Alligator mississippiensis TaxID=8496 RepID=A0A151MBC6_ALLMI|nr:hypothetical protein Y1Q_0000514 [Alligator mississippiensis]